jgi:surfeit locus 1 family protein
MTARTQRWLVTIAALALAVLTARLGFWQLDRGAQKTALQQAIETRADMPVIAGKALARTAADAAAQHHRRATLQGRWDDARTVFLDNRQLQGPQPGFVVVTPLLLDDGRAVLVQRGWAPRDPADRTRVPALPPAPPAVSVTGRIAPVPPRLLEFDAAASGRIRQNLDLDAFARETGLALAPVTLLQTAPAQPAHGDDALRREWPAPAANVSRHHGYAAQWFSLSALVLLLYVWFQFLQPIIRARLRR